MCQKWFDANKKFLIFEVHARIVAAFLVILGIKDAEEQPSDEILPQHICSKSIKEKRGFFHRLCSMVIDQYVLNADRNGILLQIDAILNFYDAISEADGARLVRCWKLMLQYLKAGGQRSRKYALKALYFIL